MSELESQTSVRVAAIGSQGQMSRGRRCGAALAVAALLLSGCYTYVPAELETVPPGREVRVQLTRRATAELPVQLPVNGPTLNGELMRKNADRFTIRVPIRDTSSGIDGDGLKQDILIPTDAILEIQRREFDGLATGLLVAGAVGAATSLILLIMDSSGSPPPDLGDPPQQMRGPILSPRNGWNVPS